MPDHSKPAGRSTPTYAWWLVLCLVGLDYFSTLAYLPSLAVARVGVLAPVAGLGVVLITLFGALPIYFYVIGRSPHGKGGVGLLERCVHGWGGKLLLLVVLGFVATDFIITRTISVSDAATHLLANPFYRDHANWVGENQQTVRSWLPSGLQGRFFDFWNEQILITVVLSVLSFGLYAFLVRGLSRGFLRIACGVVVIYMVLTAIVVGAGLIYLGEHPERVAGWEKELADYWRSENAGESTLGGLLLLGLLAFPPMALGLSGFELSMATAPLVRGSAGDAAAHPKGRIRATRGLMIVAALIMSLFVLGSMIVTPLLVPDRAIMPANGEVQHRALAYLAHGGVLKGTEPGTLAGPLFGAIFGTLYDLSTILILCLAGATATVSLKDIVPEYLSKFGMQLQWAQRVGVILHLFNVVILVVTIAFRASVTAQQSAYAASVLALLLSAALAALLDIWNRWHGSFLKPIVALPFFLVTCVFFIMALLTVGQNRSGLGIALAFVGVVVVTGFISRWLRSTELRFEGFAFADADTKRRWQELCQLHFQILVPHRPGRQTLEEKELEIRAMHRLAPSVPIIFIEAELGDPSDFNQAPRMSIEHIEGKEIIRVCRCTSIAHVLAAIGLAWREVGCPPEIHFAWSDENPMSANLNFLLLGKGNIPWMVHELVRKAEPDPARRPRVVIG
jgi:hypothetical protein